MLTARRTKRTVSTIVTIFAATFGVGPSYAGDGSAFVLHGSTDAWWFLDPGRQPTLTLDLPQTSISIPAASGSLESRQS